MGSYPSLQGESLWYGVERRSGKDRRSGQDRRSDAARRLALGNERGIEVLIGDEWDRRSGQDRRGHPLYRRRQTPIVPLPADAGATTASAGTAMPPLHTSRLLIRPLVLDDLLPVHRVQCRAWRVPQEDWDGLLADRERWVRWSVQNYEQLADMNQPPYGERAVIRKADDRLIGLVGVVPSLGPFGSLDGFPGNADPCRFYPEVGLYWAIDPDAQGHGYATEAAGAVISYLFETLQLGRVVATTEFDNIASIGVMQKLGMTVLRNPRPEPEWFQVVGVLEAR